MNINDVKNNVFQQVAENKQKGNYNRINLSQEQLKTIKDFIRSVASKQETEQKEV